ncbi:MAG TPA: hypothetical protein VHL31_11545 [Geminicoccus sp.]|jgi:hypothetical protein|uniref:hypothetical protein n=1 Tax=Geminicoccus sp. TaxID=2024832 RepID=UPI002E313D76|nr:hypothetical protein [Geminicoccus sp.]HEX2526913.1 hypothetical protein [Geminicoccus sp.]
MAMSRTSWSVSGLATEFNLDRRTVAKRLEGVIPVDLAPDGSPRWSLSDAAPALLNPREPRSLPNRPPPPGAEILLKIPNDVHGGYASAWLDIAANIRPVVASALMMSGLSLKDAKRCTTNVHAFLVRYGDQNMRKSGALPKSQDDEMDWVPVDFIQEPNWQGLVEMARQERTKQATGAD